MLREPFGAVVPIIGYRLHGHLAPGRSRFDAAADAPRGVMRDDSDNIDAHAVRATILILAIAGFASTFAGRIADPLVNVIAD